MRCRHCDSPLDKVFIDLGACPPSNAYLKDLNDKEQHYPLKVLICEKCWLVQTDISLFTLGYDELFTKDYPYFSSYSKEWLKHSEWLVKAMTERLHLGVDSMTIEIGSNDGYLLQYLKTPCLGIEPTKTGEIANAKGIETYEGFFTSRLATLLPKADWMICNNVLAHVPDINDFVKGFEICLKGVATFEFPHILNLINQNQFDTIYHEHYSYLSLTAVRNIFQSQGLQVFDVEELETHGGSLRVFADKGQNTVEPSVGEMLDREKSLDYTGFQNKADKVKNDFMEFLIWAKNEGKKVVGFGAAAKGNTLLNYSGVRSDLISYVVDETPAKQGKFLPGSRIPVKAAFEGEPDYIIIFPWNHKEEIVKKLSYMGSHFVTAVPRLEVV